MNDKIQLIAILRDEFSQWEQFLAGLTEEQITTPNPASTVPIKDVVVHLMAWQQRTLARTQAAIDDREPIFPDWPSDLDPEAEDVSQLNAWFYETHRDQTWSRVHQDWRDGYLRLIALAEQVPEADMLQKGRYAWLGEYTLGGILEASCEHHEEHLQELQAYFN